MSDPTGGTMDAVEIAEFLESQHTGVLSLADADDAYAIPVSFTYHEDEGVFLRLGFAPGSQKKRYLDATEHATFVAYDDTDEGWKSVLVEGRPEVLSHDSLDAAIVEVVEGLDIPYYQVHERPATDLQFDIVRVAPTSMSGITEAPDPGR